MKNFVQNNCPPLLPAPAAEDLNLDPGIRGKNVFGWRMLEL